jgi:predicted TIM-barrel fold metal-dependent hydrolase
MSSPRVFDADGHVIEPTDLYFDGLDPAFRDRVQADPDLGDHHGHLFPLLDGRPSFGGSPWMRDYLRTDQGKQVLVDRFGPIAEAGFDPPAMLRALDTQGIAIAALFPSFSLHVPYTEHLAPDLSLALARAYNRWITNYADDGGGRILGIAVAPLHDPAGIEREVRRAVEDEGARGVMVRPNPVCGRPLHHPANERFFSLLEDLDVPMLLHEGRGGRNAFAGDRFDTWYATHVVSHPFEMMLAVLGLTVEGVLERHPRLRVGILESGTGWLPWWLDRIDEHHARFGPHERPDLALAPSEYFLRHCVIASDSDDEWVATTVRAVGADHVAWSSDFPHLEAKWPDGAREFASHSGLAAGELEDVLWRTPCRLYGQRPIPDSRDETEAP